MLDVGDTAPDFELTNKSGVVVTLNDLLLEGPLVLYFYPADFTSLCTTEACEIRDRHDELRAVSANVVGVSPQGNPVTIVFGTSTNCLFLCSTTDKKK